MVVHLFGDRNPRHKKALKRMKKLDCLEKITSLALSGVTQPNIAKEVGVSVRTVIRNLAKFREDCLRKAESNNTELAAEALARFGHIYAEAMRAWEKSKEKGEPEQVFLARAESAQAKICELKALNAPTQPESLPPGTRRVDARIIVQDVMNELDKQPGFVEHAIEKLLQDSQPGDVGLSHNGGKVAADETPLVHRPESSAVHSGESGGGGKITNNDPGGSSSPR